MLLVSEEDKSKQNVETKAKVIDENDGLKVDKDKVDRSKETELVDRGGKE
ncbi:hypothetical protein MKW92_011293 [Papaver armeniacum]|nr:hypothetical protein MKW92_011293 [Papaver armeniacum]